MNSRRKFINKLGFVPFFLKTAANNSTVIKPIVISTWDAGIRANVKAWEVLSKGGSALDAVEQGVMVTENEKSCCVGLQANPDRDGKVTLDASIMDHHFNCGSVAFLPRIKHPISVARQVMEKTPHVMLVGSGALQFAVQSGFKLEPDTLSPEAQQHYETWLKESLYKPTPNIENQTNYPKVSPNNHDTIAMIAMDSFGNMAASCTTSGMAFKMSGRVGDSPIIGAGIYVDNNIGCAAGTGQGEDSIRIGGSQRIVHYMEQGLSPKLACKKAIEKIIAIKKEQAKNIQLAYIAFNKKGEYGGYALQKGFTFALYNKHTANKLIDAPFLI
ncbi:MAG: N(4)-(beta-N-acetylglucosaminyl)-L-asparaginase [Alphaproteobacteria bacterium]|nr:N(4)-(beta-N-acetylglucosaminyl)-L-asparaginase [Alphaproteobacteria bacterium]